MNLKILFLAVILCTIFACDDPGTDILYIDAFLELDAATNVTGEQTFTYEKILDGQPTPSGFIVNLASVQLAEAINFNFEIDANSTAIEGEHYQVNGNSGTIAPSSSTTELPISILDDNLQAGESWTIIIKISSSTIPVNPNYEVGTHIIEVSE